MVVSGVKGVWRSVPRKDGRLFVLWDGAQRMPLWCADSWDIPNTVRSKTFLFKKCNKSCDFSQMPLRPLGVPLEEEMMSYTEVLFPVRQMIPD